MGVFFVRRAETTLRFAVDIMLALSPGVLLCILYFRLLRRAIVQEKQVKDMYAMTDGEGRTRFECADSIGVVEVRAKDTDDGCSYIIFWYIDRIDKGQKKIKRIQVWDQEQVYFYVQVEECWEEWFPDC